MGFVDLSKCCWLNAQYEYKEKMKEVRIIPKGVSYVVEIMKRKWM